MNKIILPFIIFIFAIGCSEEVCDKSVSIGKIRTASVVPTSFNEMIKTQIQTDSAFVVVVGTPYIKIGAEAFIKQCGSWLKISWNGSGKWYKVIR